MSRGKPGLTPAQAEHARAALRRYRDEQCGGKASLAADVLGVTASALSQQLSGKNRPSYQTVEALARELRVTPAAILSGEALDAPPASRVVDPYPERGRALLRLRGLLAAEVEERLQSVRVHDPRPFSELEWIELAVMRQREHERAHALAARVNDNG